MRASAVCVVKNRQHVTPKGNGSGSAAEWIGPDPWGVGKRFMLGQGFRATALCWKNFSNITQGDMQASRLSCRCRPRRVPRAVHALTET